MTKRARYTISFLPTDTDLIQHLDKIKEHKTVSMYVRSLIKKDLYDEHITPDIDNVVEKVILKLKCNKDFSLSPQSNEDEIKISEEQKNIIATLF
ncbi:hypothetical protein [Metabacillus schmidteae]|uniref:hypothetical protein n=1 Tax=Metabacillus schmidteae TaxID=2730405 RepID=UPI00158D27EA|nr:hypothetical protein [Metabacillus schmidteae]